MSNEEWDMSNVPAGIYLDTEAERAGAAVSILARSEYESGATGHKAMDFFGGGGSSCAYFALWCWDQVGWPIHTGMKGSGWEQGGAYHLAKVPTFLNHAIGRGVAFGWHDPNIGDPRPGDLILVKTKKGNKGPGHMGIVEEYVPRHENQLDPSAFVQDSVKTIEAGWKIKGKPNQIAVDTWGSLNKSGRFWCFFRPLWPVGG